MDKDDEILEQYVKIIKASLSQKSIETMNFVEASIKKIHENGNLLFVTDYSLMDRLLLRDVYNSNTIDVPTYYGFVNEYDYLNFKIVLLSTFYWYCTIATTDINTLQKNKRKIDRDLSKLGDDIIEIINSIITIDWVKNDSNARILESFSDITLNEFKNYPTLVKLYNKRSSRNHKLIKIDIFRFIRTTTMRIKHFFHNENLLDLMYDDVNFFDLSRKRLLSEYKTALSTMANNVETVVNNLSNPELLTKLHNRASIDNVEGIYDNVKTFHESVIQFTIESGNLQIKLMDIVNEYKNIFILNKRK